MMSKVLSVGLLTSAVATQPFGFGLGHDHHHQHNRLQKHDKRSTATEFVTEVVTATVYEMIDEAATSWATPTASIEASNTSTGLAGKFFEGACTASVAAPSFSSPSEALVPSSFSSTILPVETTGPQVIPHMTVASRPVGATISVQLPSPLGTTPAYLPSPLEIPTNTPNAPQVSTGASGSSHGQYYEGDATYYTLGLGACGEDDSGKDNSHYIVAVSSNIMGPLSSGDTINPYCFMLATITNPKNGKTITAQVMDKCPTCGPTGIDMSEKAFVDLFGSTDQGRGNVKYSFSMGSDTEMKQTRQ